MVFIYVLELEQNKYYIGKTTNPNFRLEQHFNKDKHGSKWTDKYKPIKVLEIIHDCDNFDEDKYTLKYMEQYGINNVRGGSFCEIILSDPNIITLEQIMFGVQDKCYICGKKDHFANDCKNFTVKKEKICTVNLNEKCNCVSSYLSPHRKNKCLLNSILSYFDDEEEDEQINRLIKQNKKLSEQTQLNNKFLEQNNKLPEQTQLNKNLTCTKNKCYRCGRIGHFISNCYATTHTNGKKL